MTNINDDRMRSQAGRFATIFTIVSSLFLFLPMVITLIAMNNIPAELQIIQAIIGIKFISFGGMLWFMAIHIGVAFLINLYFKLDGQRFGYYARRKGGLHIKHPLKSIGARIANGLVTAIVITIVSQILFSLSNIPVLGIISIIFNIIMMLWQRIYYTPERALSKRK